MNATWQVVRKSPSLLTFDVQRCAFLPCRRRHHRPAPEPHTAACVVNARVFGGSVWKWAKTNIGHAAQLLFKCWSFFHAVDDHRNADSPTRRIIVDLIFYQNRFGPRWADLLMQAMDASFAPMPQTCAWLWAAPTREVYPGWGESWFSSRAAARALGSAIRGGPSVPPPPSAGLRIGVLGRGDDSTERATRGWPHADAFVQLVARTRPAGVASAATFLLGGSQTLREQLAIVEGFDLIITTHGSQSVSLAFLRPCTVVFEALAESYLVPGLFGQLAEEAGAAVFFLHAAPTVRDAVTHTVAPILATRDANTRAAGSEAWNTKKRAEFRHRTGGRFDTLSARAVLEMLPHAVRAREECLAGGAPPRVAWDGVPVIGGLRAADAVTAADILPGCFRCPIKEDDACCGSREALIAYAEGGYGCSACLNRLRATPAAEACASAGASLVDDRCRLPEVWWRRRGMWWAENHSSTPWRPFRLEPQRQQRKSPSADWLRRRYAPAQG